MTDHDEPAGDDDALGDALPPAAATEAIDIAPLQGLDAEELRSVATREGITLDASGDPNELRFDLLKQLCTDQRPGRGEGTLQILNEGYGFLRSSQHNYLPARHDIYVSPAQIHRLRLKHGHQVKGLVRGPRPKENYLALRQVETVNGSDIEGLWRRQPFEQLTPIFPQERLHLQHPDDLADVRIVELLAPWGLGQRVLLQTLPNAGCTSLLTRIVQAALASNPDLYGIVCLLGERPEEVTEMRRLTGPETQREVLAATFDEPAARLIDLSRLALAKAQRMVETGHDVLLVMDSLNALVRAYHEKVPHSGKMLAVGLDAAALQAPRQLFGSARNTQEAGSLTIIATAAVDTGSRLDDLIAAEFLGKGNSDLVFDRTLADEHIYPALDLNRSRTRREDWILSPQEAEQLRTLRTQLAQLDRRQRLVRLQELIESHADNAGILAAVH